MSVDELRVGQPDREVSWGCLDDRDAALCLILFGFLETGKEDDGETWSQNLKLT